MAPSLLVLALLTACPPSDGNGDGQVSINEVVVVVTAALEGCEPADRFVHTAGFVTDRQTGLIWEAVGCGEPETLTFVEAEAKAESFNQQARNGRRDWRVPSLADWMSLITNSFPADGFVAGPCPCSGPVCNQSPVALFWTSTPGGDGHEIVVIEDFEHEPSLDHRPYAVRLVAGP